MIASGEVSESLTFSDTQKMPYLQAVIKEGIRIHPAAGLPLQRVVPKGGVKLAGQFFPEGVSSSLYDTMRRFMDGSSSPLLPTEDESTRLSPLLTRHVNT